MARVLIIDDDVPFRQALAKYFEIAGYDVKQAADGDAGIRACATSPADVVLVDIFMPGQGGLKTIDRMRLEWPGVKIIAISGVTSAGSLDVEGHALALGAHRFVSKPFEGAAMVSMVKQLLAGAPQADSSSD